MSDDSVVISLLSLALNRIHSTPPRVIASPPTQPRRAAVALIIRITPPPNYPVVPSCTSQPSVSDFFKLDWVNAPGACPEILFLKRQSQEEDAAAMANNRLGNASEAHVAFPGGRMEEGDEGACYTAMRQTWEEIGLDLAERDFVCVGQLDDREITTSLGKRLLMILSPFVFLQLTSTPTITDPVEGTSIHWIPLSMLLCPNWSTVSVDCSSRLAPRNSLILKYVMRALIGSMQFPAILLPDLSQTDGKNQSVISKYFSEKTATRLQTALTGSSGKQLKLWGLSLGMTLDLLSFMALESSPSSPPFFKFPLHTDNENGMGAKLLDGEMRAAILKAPSLTSVFPRFSYPDVNFWIWVFGKRYREVIRGWESSLKASGTNDRRINWTGAALNTFYAAIRKALVVVLVVRAIFIITGVVVSAWWVFLR